MQTFSVFLVLTLSDKDVTRASLGGVGGQTFEWGAVAPLTAPTLPPPLRTATGNGL